MAKNNKFKILSVNARGVANETKRRAFFDYHRINADILVVQETHCTESQESIWTSEWGGKAIFSHGTNKARGIAVFTTKEMFTKIKNIYKDEEGRQIIFDLHEEDQYVTIAAIYAPNEDKPEFFKKLRQHLRNRLENKIIIGDFNLTLDVELDRKNTYCNNNRSKEELEDLMEEFMLQDIWRVHNGEKRQYSWMKSGNINKASRIDLALVSRGIDQKVQIVTYEQSVKTDHRAIYMVVDLNYVERGRGYWKFNTSLLQDKEFVEIMNKEIDRSINTTQHLKPQERWERLKEKIKKCTCKYTRDKGVEDKLVIGQLSEIVNEYESNLPLNREEYILWEQTKEDLQEKLMERAKGIMFRSKVKWYEEGERNTKYFFNLEKMKYNAKTCYKLLEEDGTEITEQQMILEKQKDFYSELYDIDQDVEFTSPNTSGIYVPDPIQTDQNQQITIKELEVAIRTMNRNKTPGEDGIPVDFYKVFWIQIKEVFYEMMISSYEEKYLHDSARKGILNLIPKPNKDSRQIKNLRPITLLNTDYKIIEKAVANKMLPALEHIIHKDQRGFMKNRRISVNIRKMLDIIHEANKEDLEAVILSLDFVKCFDKCSFSILYGSLDFFKFGEIIKEWTRILYKDFTVRIQNNGNFSTEIPIKKGVHQGGCCSAVYFLVIAEILAIALRNNQEIEGLTIKDIRNLLNQFADDMDIFSLCTEKSVKAILEELNKFKSQSGFTVSYDKTTLYRIGSLRHSNAQMYGLSQYVWSREDITVLGVKIAHEELIEKNYQDIIEKVKKQLQAWTNRGLSLIGKIQVVNTLIASLFVYKMMVLPKIPCNIVKTVNNMIREYIWNGKKSKIAYNILQNRKQDGGLNLVNIEKRDTALKATWPIILKNEEEYSKMVYKIMRCNIIEEDIWRCSLEPMDIKKLKINNQFWKDVLEAWGCYNYYHQRRIDNQYIWYNSGIKIGGKVILWGDVYLRGLKYVYQLFQDGKYKTEDQVWEEYGLTKLRFNSLKSAIPQEWKNFFISNSSTTYLPIAPHNYDYEVSKGGQGLSKRVYQYISEDILLVHNKYIKWRKELGGEYQDVLTEFGKAHMDIYRITNVPKYRSFQYRLLQRGLVTNIQLHHWQLLDTNMCTLCGKQKESLIHLFYECEKTQILWKQITLWMKEKYKVTFQLNATTVIMNRIVKKAGHVVNFICLITKQYIYRQRCLKEEINFQGLKSTVRKIESIEKYIATKNQKLDKHNRKWGSSETWSQLENGQQDFNCEEYARLYLDNTEEGTS